MKKSKASAKWLVIEKERARLVVERFGWMIVLSSEGGPRNPDPGTTYCFAHDFVGTQD